MPVYPQKSSKNQKDIELSISKQLNAIQNYCNYNGLKLTNQFIDISKSANTDKRPKFQEMIAKVNESAFNKIIIYSFDRFSRNFHDFLKYLSILKKNGVSIYSISENTELPDSFPFEEIINVIKTYPTTVSKHINTHIKEKKKGSENNG